MGQTVLAVTIPEAGDMLRVSRATVYNLINTGQLRTVKIMGATRVPISSIRELIGDVAE